MERSPDVVEPSCSAPRRLERNATGNAPRVNDAGRDDDGQVEEEFRSLLEGLRTTLPGAQIITAFLLTLPFYERFGALDQRERAAYYIACGRRS